MRRPALGVLMYHRIADRDAGPPGIVSATPAAFARQMDWLARSGRAVTLADVLDARADGRRLRRGAVLVTFDDAYADLALVAWPVMRAYGIRPVVFVPTAFPDADGAAFWWDRLHGALTAARGRTETPAGVLDLRTAPRRRAAYRALRDRVKALPHEEAMALVDDVVGALGAGAPAPRVLGWEELRALAREGVDLAPHTRTHPRLDRLAPERLAGEIDGGLDDLRRHAGTAAPVFAYPAGGVSEEAVAAVRRAGFTLAFTTRRGTNDVHLDDPLRLARINVGRRTGVAALRVQLAAPPRRAPREATPVPRSRPGVAYVMSRFPKVSETFVVTEILAMERRGVRVEVFPLLRERPRIVHPEAAALVERAHYVPMLSPAVLASQLHWLRRRPRAYLGALRDVARGTLGSLNFFVGGLAVFPKVAHAARLMQAAGVGHVHCHFANHPAVAGLIVHRLTGLPYSFTAHGSDVHVERRMLAEKVAEASFVATVSEYNRRLIIGACGGRYADKVHVVRAGVDTRRFATGRADPAPGPPASLRVVCVGTLHEVKGQRHLVEACRLLDERGIDVRCRMIGDGEDRRRLERQIAAGGLAGRVELVGAATSAQVAAELRRADVLVAPSVPTAAGRREGIPVVLMEAMSSGLPVVSSRLSGIPELVTDGETGLLTAPGDADALADALALLHADPVLRARLGRQARARVLEEFDVARSAEQLASRIGMAVAA